MNEQILGRGGFSKTAHAYDLTVKPNIFGPPVGLGGLNRVVKGAATVKTGTCEVARILGRGAIGMPTPMDLSFTEETRDMGFRSALCGHKMIGRVRLDFVNAAKTLTKNISSGLFFTSTPSIVY